MTTPRHDPLPESLLRDIAEGIAASTSLWRSVVCHDDDLRRPVRLLATDQYEVWVIGWSPGQGVDLHDHGDAAGALAVTDGELVELRPRTDASGRPSIDRTVLGPGDVVPLPIGLVHDVVNVGTRPATSIHVYSPPLATMTRYDAVTLEPLGTEPVAPEVPALSAPSLSALLHPSTRS